MKSGSVQSIIIKKAVKDKNILNDLIINFLYKLKLKDSNSIYDLESELSKEIRLPFFSKFVKCLPNHLWYEAVAERLFDFEGLINELNNVDLD